MQPHAHHPRAIGAVRTLIVLLALSAAACSSGAMEVSPRPGVEGERALDGTDWPSASGQQLVNGCVNDEAKVCSYYLPEHNGVRPCVVGYQICSDNMWSRCTEGVLVDAGAPAGQLSDQGTDGGG